MWLFFYTPEIGLLDQVVGRFGEERHNWLGDPATVSGRRDDLEEAGFFMIFYSRPRVPAAQIGEAAALEGASRRAFFWRVTFPLGPTTLFVLVNAVINSALGWSTTSSS